MDTIELNPKAVSLCAWMGPGLTVLFFIGFVPLADFLPPLSPSASSEQVAAMYQENVTGIRTGTILMMLAMTLLAAWGVGVAAWTRHMERGVPLLTYLQVACMGAGVSVTVGFCVCWGVAAFRPDITPDIVRALNDTGWFLFLFLFIWPVFDLWAIAISLAILWDSSGQQIFPRWSAFLGIWVALLSVPAALIIYFKSGVFSFAGLFGMYIPLFVYFIFIVTMSWLSIRAARRFSQGEPVGTARTPAPLPATAPR